MPVNGSTAAGARRGSANRPVRDRRDVHRPGRTATSCRPRHALDRGPRRAPPVEIAVRGHAHTLTLLLSHEGRDGFETTQTPDEILALFRKDFSDPLPMLPQTAPWRYEDWMTCSWRCRRPTSSNCAGRWVRPGSWPANARRSCSTGQADAPDRVADLHDGVPRYDAVW
jgi:hypothetical protein